MAGVLLTAGACVPAQTPPQLEATPGPSVTVTENRYSSPAFSVGRPAGWRVITSSVGVPPSVIFVSPDDTALFIASTAAITNPPAPPVEADAMLVQQRETVETDDGTIYLYAAAPGAAWPGLELPWTLFVGSVGPGE